MFTVRTVLHPTDLWDTSSTALEVAAGMAAAFQARLILLHVWQEPLIITGGAEPVPALDMPGLREEARQKLEALTLPAAVGSVERRFADGEAAEEILRAASDTGCDLIVMGTHGRSGLERLLLGSVAEQVVRRAACPVVTVKPIVAK